MGEESTDLFSQLVLSTEPVPRQSNGTLPITSSQRMARYTALLFRLLYAYHPHEAKGSL